MRIVLAQINPTIGDLKGNLAIIQEQIALSTQNEVDVVVFPEMATCGYPPRDLLYDENLWKSHEVVIQKIQQFIKSLGKHITAIVGGIHKVELTHGRYSHFNAAFVIDSSSIKVVHKRLLPCYDVFDETRYFTSDLNEPYLPIPIKNKHGQTFLCDILICEDIWNYGFQTAASWMSPASYQVDPIACLRGDGPIIVLNASPYWAGKIQTTRELLQRIALGTGRNVFWCNQVGGQDDIIFGGYSMVASPTPISHMRFGNEQEQGCIAMAALFAAERLEIEIVGKRLRAIQALEMNFEGGEFNPVIKIGPARKSVEAIELENYFMFAAIQTGLRDYCRRTGFTKIVFGSSGGIDSAVVGAIATLTLGAENCTAITMPSPYSSEGSVTDSEELAKRCKYPLLNLGIKDIYAAAKGTLLRNFETGFKHRVTDENLQPRIRALLLMAHSNDTGALLLTTGNKSEIAVGYCTIYGDMCGGYALLSDVFKTWVYCLAAFINKYFGDLIPQSIITKEPSAELAEGQKDTDNLPAYDKLDPLIMRIVRHDSIESIQKHSDLSLPEIVKVLRLIDISEYKRSQAPIGPKVTERAFGSGRRIPITKKIQYI